LVSPKASALREKRLPLALPRRWKHRLFFNNMGCSKGVVSVDETLQ